MDALFDQNGRAYAWVALANGRIHGLDGRNLAFIEGDSVFDWQGRHIAWWQDGHIRDHEGAAALFSERACDLGVLKPSRAVTPLEPICAAPPIKPVRQAKPPRPTRQIGWTSRMPF